MLCCVMLCYANCGSKLLCTVDLVMAVLRPVFSFFMFWNDLEKPCCHEVRGGKVGVERERERVSIHPSIHPSHH